MECRRLGSAEKNVRMKAHFYSLAEVAQQIRDQKIIATQEAYSTYRRTKAKIVQADSETVHPKTATSMKAFEVFSKRLNLVQVYLKGKAFLMQFSTNLQLEDLKRTVVSVVNVKKKVNEHTWTAIAW